MVYFWLPFPANVVFFKKANRNNETKKKAVQDRPRFRLNLKLNILEHFTLLLLLVITN